MPNYNGFPASSDAEDREAPRIERPRQPLPRAEREPREEREARVARAVGDRALERARIDAENSAARQARAAEQAQVRMRQEATEPTRER